MPFKPIDDRQVINRAALTNIGSPADDTLDDIFSRIDAILAGASNATGYIAKKTNLTTGTTFLTVTIPSQPDTSYTVLGMMGNTTDSFPQYQEVEVTSKSVSGFTFTWNHSLDSSSYFLSYVVLFKTIPQIEAAVGSGANTLASILPIAQSGSGYGVIAALQNTVDAHPQFQTVVIGSNSTTTANFEFNTATDTANYVVTYALTATGQVTIPNSATSVVIPMPVNFNTASYAIIASVQNTVDAHPQFQPLVITSQSGVSATISWNIPRDTGSYLLNYYAISLTT